MGIVIIVLDMKEKGRLLMMKSCVDWFSCHLCYVKGVLVGRKIYYPFDSVDGVERRTKLSCEMDQYLAKKHVGKDRGLNKCTAFRGLKGEQLFSNLKNINIPRSFSVENMHVDSGIQLTLVNRWKSLGILNATEIRHERFDK